MMADDNAIIAASNIMRVTPQKSGEANAQLMHTPKSKGKGAVFRSPAPSNKKFGAAGQGNANNGAIA